MHDQKGGGVRLGGSMAPKGILMGGDRSLGRDGLPSLSHQASTMQLLPHHSMSNIPGTGNGSGYGPPHNHLQHNQQYQQRDQQAREMQQHRQSSGRNRSGNRGDLMGKLYKADFYMLFQLCSLNGITQIFNVIVIIRLNVRRSSYRQVPRQYERNANDSNESDANATEKTNDSSSKCRCSWCSNRAN